MKTNTGAPARSAGKTSSVSSSVGPYGIPVMQRRRERASALCSPWRRIRSAESATAAAALYWASISGDDANGGEAGAGLIGASLWEGPEFPAPGAAPRLDHVAA